MNRPMTDRERALAAEARIAELEEEVAAWRSYGRQEERADVSALEIDDVKLWIRSFAGSDHARGAARALIAILSRRDALCSRPAMLRALGANERDSAANIVSVRISALRKALAVAGHAGAVRTVYGDGYTISSADAEAIEADIEAFAGRLS